MALVLPPVFLDAADNGQPEPRFQIMVIILVISLLGEQASVTDNTITNLFIYSRLFSWHICVDSFSQNPTCRLLHRQAFWHGQVIFVFCSFYSSLTEMYQELSWPLPLFTSFRTLLKT